MLEYKGKYNSAIVMTDVLDEATTTQIYSFLNHPAFSHSHIAIMADTHAGAGSVVGFTMKINDYIIPNVVGVDIGCGVNAYPLEGVKNINFEQVDKFIRMNIPSGFGVRSDSKEFDKVYFSNNLVDKAIDSTHQEKGRVYKSLGTLGGGNHFIEIDVDPNGQYWLLVHTGSRNFGLKIAQWHQAQAKELMKTMFQGDTYKGLEFLPKDLPQGKAYLEDMAIAQQFAMNNRYLIGKILMDGLFNHVKHWKHEYIECVHNYINFEDNIIRKGAISANSGERVLIPLNMRDGTIIGTGKGSSKWNNSAPHGAGRIMSRSKAKENIDLADYKKSMEGIFTTSANQSTIDEAPMAYKGADMIKAAIGETVSIDFVMKPVYNFKAGED
jgi:tRNA-splicing ligase RtcB (3'-phosphate/5'-hydroxy nucleic acid ligase)